MKWSATNLGAMLAWLALVAAAAETAAPARVTQELEGAKYEFAPDREPVARALAPMVATLNRDLTKQFEEHPKPPATPTELSVADLRARRGEFLARIAAAIGLERATVLQEDCYDGFLDNFERTNRVLELLVAKMRRTVRVGSVSIWDRDDILRRLKAGEKIAGFSLDPDGEHGRYDWRGDWQGQDDEIAKLFAERQQRRLDYGYNLEAKNGVVSVSGHFGPRRPVTSPPPASPGVTSTLSEATSMPMALVIDAERAKQTPTEIAQNGADFFRHVLTGYGQATAMAFEPPGQLAFLILHETAEVGIVERYIGSRDRRWFCDGVANYVAWKVARDMAGPDRAREVYDLDAALAKAAEFRSKVDLKKWPASEHQKPEESGTPLNVAYYTFATRAVFELAARHGEDFLPKLFREIGATPRAKVDGRTIERAYQKLTREKLDVVLAAAVAAPTPSKK